MGSYFLRNGIPVQSHRNIIPEIEEGRRARISDMMEVAKRLTDEA